MRQWKSVMVAVTVIGAFTFLCSSWSATRTPVRELTARETKALYGGTGACQFCWTTSGDCIHPDACPGCGPSCWVCPNAGFKACLNQNPAPGCTDTTPQCPWGIEGHCVGPTCTKDLDKDCGSMKDCSNW